MDPNYRIITFISFSDARQCDRIEIRSNTKKRSKWNGHFSFGKKEKKIKKKLQNSKTCSDERAWTPCCLVFLIISSWGDQWSTDYLTLTRLFRHARFTVPAATAWEKFTELNRENNDLDLLLKKTTDFWKSNLKFF